MKRIRENAFAGMGNLSNTKGVHVEGSSRGGGVGWVNEKGWLLSNGA